MYIIYNIYVQLATKWCDGVWRATNELHDKLLTAILKQIPLWIFSHLFALYMNTNLKNLFTNILFCSYNVCCFKCCPQQRGKDNVLADTTANTNWFPLIPNNSSLAGFRLNYLLTASKVNKCNQIK